MGRASPRAIQATVQGTVTDGKGGVVQSATVALKDQATQVARTTTTGADGFYRFSEVAPGTYTVTVEANGFQKSVTNDVAVSAELARGLDVALTVGQVKESITVNGTNIPNLQTEEGNVEGTLTNQEVQRLPSFSRDPYELLRFAPGVFGDAARTGVGQSCSVFRMDREQTAPIPAGPVVPTPRSIKPKISSRSARTGNAPPPMITS